MTGPRRFWLVAALALALLGRTGLPSHAQPADESPAAMDARLAAAAVTRVGPSYLYPDHATTPGVVNPAITQANIQQTICTRGWTATVRPPASYTGHLKQQRLAAAQATDRSPAHYEEDHLVSLELGGHPHDARNLWPERWGTPVHPLTSRGPFPSHLVGAKAKDATENALNREVCRGTLTLREAQWIIATDWFKYYLEKILHRAWGRSSGRSPNRAGPGLRRYTGRMAELPIEFSRGEELDRALAELAGHQSQKAAQWARTLPIDQLPALARELRRELGEPLESALRPAVLNVVRPDSGRTCVPDPVASSGGSGRAWMARVGTSRLR